MPINYGKKFEEKFKEDWSKIPFSFILRLPDQVSKKKGSRNPCDFIGFAGNCLWLLECKSFKSNTYSLDALRQYDDLLACKGYKDVYPGVVLWWIKHKRVAWIPIETFEKLKKMNPYGKSINIKMLDDKEFLKDNLIVEIPATKIKKVFSDSDYSILVELAREGKLNDK